MEHALIDNFELLLNRIDDALVDSQVHWNEYISLGVWRDNLIILCVIVILIAVLILYCFILIYVCDYGDLLQHLDFFFVVGVHVKGLVEAIRKIWM